MSNYQAPMKPWPALEPYASQVRLPVSDLTLFCYDAGPEDAPPLLLVHGLGDEADTWRHLISPLSASYRVLAPDLPGFGRSDKPKRSYTLAFFQEVMSEFLAELGIESVTLAGHSLGAAIVHAMALASPVGEQRRVQRLVLLDGSLVTRSRPLDRGTLLFLVPGLGEWLYNRLRRDPEAAYESLGAYFGHLDRLPVEDREFLFQRVNERVWSDGQRRAFFSTLRHLARDVPRQQKELAARLAGLATPTLVIWGELDQLNPPENGRATVELQPEARFVLVSGAGHNVHQENPQAVLKAMGSLAVA
jgi:pimeloyl-ACP methyl ester carboxylesterase